MRVLSAIVVASFFLVMACQESHNTVKPHAFIVNESSSSFNSIWFAGKASVAVYDLKQLRYGQVRKGFAALVTVSEPFDGKAQVKSDASNAANYQVMKTNLMKKFNTGIYDYATMTSAFVPINTEVLQDPVKITFGSQDWCGQVFNQWNKNENDYVFRGFSYFQSEGDVSEQKPIAYFQDALLASIRLNPKNLPKGDVKLYLSNENYRFLHKPIVAYKSTCSLSENDSALIYTVINDVVKLEYVFGKKPPHTVFQFSEALQKDGGYIQKTIATLNKEDFRPYWNENRLSSDTIRHAFKMPFFDLQP